MAQREDGRHPGRLNLVQGTALYVTAVLGTGVITLPAIAARIAGPASLLAWLLLALLSAPLASTFAALGARFGDGGGVSTYVRMTYGDQAAAMVGWCFYLAVPTGTATAAVFGGAYVAAATGGGAATTFVTATVLVTIAVLINVAGLRLVGRVQLLLAVLLVTVLLVASGASMSQADTANLVPFAPHGWLAIVPAAATLVWSFVGWEAITHLHGEFRNPARDVPRATWAAVVLVGALYLVLAYTVITVLGSAAAKSDAPLGELLAVGLGGQARVLAAAAATTLTLGATTAYLASAAKLGARLADHGDLPARLGRGDVPGTVPRHSLALVATLTYLSLLAIVILGVGVETLLRMTNGALVAVYVIGAAAAVRLLPRGTRGHRAAVLSLVTVLLLLLSSGRYLFWPVAIGVAALLFQRLRRRPEPTGVTTPRAGCAGSKPPAATTIATPPDAAVSPPARPDR
ncbi:amino acid permease [Micromonospora sp. WMMA1363]|uniref:APC family permease n=1 Tax=Micromonospora sp. WMMA1363 TaxID=3053985 RepID=UPI00259CAFB7|nr:amino acid permease [Micromonospora sp. WMMA1363]MDM4721511.1 amino acid permease [Micromonospora sp. WMMA1363]